MARSVDARTWLQRALLLIIIGLIVQLFCLVHVTPATFLLFAFAGVGPVVLGLGSLAVASLRHRQAQRTREGDDAVG